MARPAGIKSYSASSSSNSLSDCHCAHFIWNIHLEGALQAFAFSLPFSGIPWICKDKAPLPFLPVTSSTVSPSADLQDAHHFFCPSFRRSLRIVSLGLSYSWFSPSSPLSVLPAKHHRVLVEGFFTEGFLIGFLSGVFPGSSDSLIITVVLFLLFRRLPHRNHPVR